jgi:TonB family protein
MTSRSTTAVALVAAALSISATAAKAQSTPAVAITDHLIRAEDYPRQSIRSNEQGTVGVAFTINTDGEVTECSVAISSGKPRLDEAACALVIRRWRYKPATENGMPVTQNATANIVFQLRGRGEAPNQLALGQAAVSRGDYATAIARWTPRAEQENPAARSGLGVLYANGQGVAQDYTEAARWYQLAAAQGFAFAQVSLAQLYESGRGVPENPLKALMWFTLALAAPGDVGAMARQNNERLRQRMAQPQIDQVDEMVARCRQSLYKDCE